MRFEGMGLGIVKGMALTLRHAFRPIITTQYPEEKLVPSKRIRAPQLVWEEDRCTVCATCAKACPQGNITIVSEPLPGNKYGMKHLEIDHGRCMFCGLCVEACPFDAIHLGRDYEQATYRRSQLVLTREEVRLSEKRKPSGYFRPRFEAEMPPQTLLIYGEKKGK